METLLIGRKEEKAILLDLIHSTDPELLAVYGRRRVGKTFLIRNVLENHLVFEYTGIHKASFDQQLENFSQALASASSSSLPLAKPLTWMEAFNMLTPYLIPLIKKQRKAIFFDEFPWIYTARSGFMQAFEHFWNSWASRQNNLIVVICGSAAAWMIDRVINNKGGLHNRVTKRIRLLPFNLMETEAFLKERKVNLDKYQVLQLYMVMGGIPHYLKEIKVGESATKAIDRICFSESGFLHSEFKNLYQSLFDRATSHITIIRALAGKAAGLTREEIIKVGRFGSGGGITQILEELTESGFITPYFPLGKTTKKALYKLTDEYSLFYLKFIERHRIEDPGLWVRLSKEPSWKSWSGYAFESVCFKHIRQLKKALGIEGLYSETSGWRYKPDKGYHGTQIDLLIDRQDHCINLCEIKFSTREFIIDKAYAQELENKIRILQDQTKTRKTILLTLITTYGVKKNEYSDKLLQGNLSMGALFE